MKTELGLMEAGNPTAGLLDNGSVVEDPLPSFNKPTYFCTNWSRPCGGWDGGWTTHQPREGQQTSQMYGNHKLSLWGRRMWTNIGPFEEGL